MINIFNLFLVLLFCWLMIAFANNVLSWFYLFLGIIAAAVISFIAWKIKLINKNTNFLFLSLGFYKHFMRLFFVSFFKSIILLTKLTFSKSISNPVIYYLPMKKQSSSELALFISTISLTPGLFCIGMENDEIIPKFITLWLRQRTEISDFSDTKVHLNMNFGIIIHALGEEYFDKDALNKIYNNLHRINDNRLV